MYEYEKDTRQAYRNVEKAQLYRSYQSQDLSWGRVTSWRRRLIVHKALASCDLSPQDKILDIPCGTGIIGDILQQFPNPVVGADISTEMMELARSEYAFSHFLGFVQADITQTSFQPGDFACIFILGLMHRLPANIRGKVLAEIATLKPQYLIISYSLDSPCQRLKQRLIKKLKPSHIPAPVPAAYPEIIQEVNTAGFKVRRTYQVVPLLSAEIILILEKKKLRNFEL
jgi:ubiquinone/menaquinone biosynthesis C-methylase UbiE